MKFNGVSTPMQSCGPVRLPMLLVATVFGLAACVPNRPAPAPPPAPVWQPEPEELGEAPEIVEARVTAPKRDVLGDVVYDLPLEANSWVEAELDFLVNERRDVIERWIQRGDYYEDFVKAELRRQGIPTDLYHLAMIESGFLPTARSRVGAVGMWQFMTTTGKAMGLRIDGEVDERMDPVRSTRAAARHLRDLYRSMGSWALAAAAYNAGPGRINRGLRAYSARDFWELAERGDLAAETKHYVPRLYAMTVIVRGRERFGFASTSERSFAFDSVHVEYATPLQELARMGDITVNELTSLNPHLVEGITPSGGYWVWVPVTKGPELQRAYLASDLRKERGYATYVVRRGDFLGRIAERSGVRASRIRELNPKVRFEPLQIGVKLRLPYAAAQKLAARAEEAEKPVRVAASGPAESSPAPAPTAAPRKKPDADAKTPATSGRTHQVRSGESLWQIARANGTTVEALQKVNGLEGATIRPGMELELPASTSSSAVPASEPARHRVSDGETLWEIARTNGVTVEALQKANGLESETIRPGMELTVPAGGAAQPVTAEHVVSGGETLWGIARKYGSSVDAIQKANGLGQRPIQPGQKLSIPHPARP